MTNINRILYLAGVEKDSITENLNTNDVNWKSSITMIAKALDLVRALPLNEWVPTEEVYNRMTAKGHSMSLRSVQRYLNGYSQYFGIQKRQNGKTLEWKRTTSLEV